MTNNKTIRGALVATACATACFGAMAQQQKPANEQVVVPQVDRRDIQVPKFPSNDFEIGLFGGTYATQNFGTSAVGGVKLGYHITEDFFVEDVYAQTKVSDESFRQIPSTDLPTEWPRRGSSSLEPVTKIRSQSLI